ncbi:MULTISPECIES: phosphoribosyl-ATP pyrophosphatase [Chryseobacterium]|uniref:Phosphoribosyl-ATP pyrophosphohydrolase n=1 Tax=Chryseobacterium camelliae TaxID=1265445 RepID=A0ABU0TGG8_9FLAO|nr:MULTISPECIES: phosphoribosyl-ATP pyrophosphatase [Chryseobacterium]MDT3406063.1 phosphoribosyl-ATP pyrophosphohydrolase [Pseudacidovorax intermedius]MDQ1096137.1 phosphoribosyl-ATP pyrophosphohydrolase [Chryseobacterium camelliae]MDQ1100073.1 phosphoribosyl-ATP pyrophosphohydrolase [Chryseobacterium sp. SORGH_AS_1048]MDR6087417.1 phosphoribosyl-ATP pyrophosphohydrolase [Chryseobacterium sp. SORGH_AS_0909]MDR6131791.1 phosphoribosyl-ATP pyrophosphohydrolase [Chryseobacterium sp. SORGH_AS_117
MGIKYDSLEELRRKKNLLKSDISNLEELLTFKNTKESLSAFTNGLTDQYLQEKVDENGDEKVVLRKDVIAKQVTSEVKDLLISKNTAMGIAGSALKGNAVDALLKLAVTAIVGNVVKKNIKSSNWKKKVLGIALVYLAPVALKFIRKKLENYQKNKSVSSMEQLI